MELSASDRLFFELLTKDRMESADMLEKPSMRGIKDSVVEKYSDQAHFIYELLQNADDANATEARFVLEQNRLVFAHNGTRHFTVTDPRNEEEDSKNGTLGDINSITAIANSSKKSEATIGKFGVGFKAVFQYTSTPHIYDINVRFKIERFIVPTYLEEDFEGRRQEETLFVFPFDHKDRTSYDAVKDISEKLKNLSYPVLFLSCLKRITFKIANTTGCYEKRVIKQKELSDGKAELISIKSNNGSLVRIQKIWMFSRKDSNDRYYSVGFFISDYDKLYPVKEPAFCFFPTKETTGLNFIIHAPFLLTDSREGIRAGVDYNDRMIILLAELAADALEILKNIGIEEGKNLLNDNLFDIIPYDEENFSNPDDKTRVSFLPFYTFIKKKLERSELLPTSDGCVGPEDAYWAAVPQLTKLFSNDQLADIVSNPNANWVFTSLGRDEVQRNNKALFSYLDGLARAGLTEDIIINGRSRDYYYSQGQRISLENIKGIDVQFIENQEIDWLHKFYKWVSETRHRTDLIRNKEIFLDQDGNAVAAYDKDNQLILFLPVENINGYKIVNEQLLDNEDTRKFINEIGIKQPSLRDQIYNIILPQYEDDGEIDTTSHFMMFFKYYCKCPNEEIGDFLNLIKKCEFVRYYSDGEIYRGKADTIYYPSNLLKDYFETKEDVRFLDLENYIDLVDDKQRNKLELFLDDIGVKKNIPILERTLYRYEREDLPRVYSTRGTTYEEHYIDGCEELLEYIVSEHDIEKSKTLWNGLLNVIENNCTRQRDLSFVLLGICHYFYYSSQIKYYDSINKKKLRELKWIVNKNGEFVSPSEISLDDLSQIYDIDSEYANELIEFLKFKEEEELVELEEDDSNLTDRQREQIEFAKKWENAGLTDEDFEEFLNFKRMKEINDKSSKEEESKNDTSTSEFDKKSNKEKEDNHKPVEKNSFENGLYVDEVDKETSEIINDIYKKTRSHSYHDTVLNTYDFENQDEDDIDEDEWMPSTVNYNKKIERAKAKSASEIDRIVQFQNLQDKAINSVRYTYEWFMALLEMECINNNEFNANSREVSISFSKIEKEPGTQRIYVLKYPSRYIPQFMEDLSDIPMILHIGNETKTIAIEVANIKSYTLRVKIKPNVSMEGIDLSSVNSITIDAKSPVFLLNELKKQFSELGLEANYNLQTNLCDNIKFIFGPPGTGKTTYLAKDVIIPFMKRESECKVLVLTPTNKSADVLVKRIMEVEGNDKSYEEWLVRFGATGDEEIEQSPVYKEKTYDIRTSNKNVTVTTIARFPYDFFMPQGSRVYLNGINWDYIIIDEASMIPIVNIVYPLYKKTPKQFIIAGDPFQIEPITSVDLWKNENIYTMVHLDSFVNPTTILRSCQIKLLTKQYRSIPEVGKIFSEFTYGGILEHYRNSDDQVRIDFGNDIDVKTLNIIKFPVRKYESIYKCKKLQKSSSYQIYSAIFTHEFVLYLSKIISELNPGLNIKIGVIAPYRAQADMIEKLLSSENIPNSINVQVGTIHGFQGDECDIIFAVFNPPPSISTSKDIFLNKRNIVNVSISRAKDYLFVIMPDDVTENVNNLKLIKNVEKIIKSSRSWKEFKSKDLEYLMFNDDKYLENNVFSTSHQSVNVYGLPEKCYEVRTEDTAVDVQIHRSYSNHNDKGKELINTYKNPSKRKYVDSYDLQEEFIPEELRKAAIDIPVKGDRVGWYFLVPYDGKLKDYTDSIVEHMFIPQTRNGMDKLISVSVVESERIIYISRELYVLYEDGLCDPDGIELIEKDF